MEGNPSILAAHFHKELLQILLLNLELIYQFEELEHAVPAREESATVVLEVRHVDVQHVGECLSLPFQTVALDLF